MITKQQLQEVGGKLNTKNLIYVEKEYLQHLFLYNLYSTDESFIFKGGTALKIAYRHPRYSVDLDFYVGEESETIQKTVHKVLEKLTSAGIKNKFKSEKLFVEKKTYTSEILFEGPLFDGSESNLNSIKIDAGPYSNLIMHPSWIPVTPVFPDIPTYHVHCMAIEEIFAEKLRAMYEREDPKDFYDLVVLIDRYKVGISLNFNPEFNSREALKIIDQKLTESEIKFNPNKIKYPSREKYERLADLVPMLPDYNQSVNKVKAYLKR